MDKNITKDYIRMMEKMPHGNKQISNNVIADVLNLEIGEHLKRGKSYWDFSQKNDGIRRDNVVINSHNKLTKAQVR